MNTCLSIKMQRIMIQNFAAAHSMTISQKTRQGLSARAAQMAKVCKKKHSHFSRCEVDKK